ncbi:DUF6804 family protein [Chitinophaga sp. 22536]|uniref:DUF6804 family protein n=1 Tax=unclassified Chitinophaga TaxID=2619133 RepID=UPI003F87665D
MSRYLIWLLKLILIVLCGICLLRMPYQYYVLFRYVSFILFLLFCLDAFARRHTNLGIVWAVSALLINPWIKPVLGRALWHFVDVVWIVIILGSLLADLRNINRGN